MNLRDLYFKGTFLEEFLLTAKEGEDLNLIKHLQSIEFSDEVVEKLKNANIHTNIVVCAEITCPDCVIGVALLEKLKRIVDIHYMIIDKETTKNHLDSYTNTEVLKVPTMVFMDKTFTDLGTFVERPKVVKKVKELGDKEKYLSARDAWRAGKHNDDFALEILEFLS